MINKIYYFNDEKQHVTVTVMDGAHDGFYRLAPLEDIYLSILVPEGHILYIKKWDGRILFSHMPEPQPLAKIA